MMHTQRVGCTSR